MELVSNTDSLVKKVDLLLENYKKLKNENEELITQLTTYKAQNEIQKDTIDKLKDELSSKSKNASDLLRKIEDVLE